MFLTVHRPLFQRDWLVKVEIDVRQGLRIAGRSQRSAEKRERESDLYGPASTHSGDIQPSSFRADQSSKCMTIWRCFVPFSMYMLV